MKTKIHGIISLLLFTGVIIIGVIGINKFSKIFTLAYLLIVTISFLIIIYSYCTKCKCYKDNCAHLIVGIIAKYLPKRKIHQVSEKIGIFNKRLECSIRD